MKSNWWAVACLLMLAGAYSHAALMVAGTRIIFEQQQAQAVVQISNQGAQPLLAQMWIDRGQDGLPLEDISVPFTIVPAVARLDPGKAQTVRILQAAQEMPADRESLFWFNALEVPPKISDGGRIMQFTLRTRIKLFYRPQGLRMTPAQAHERLQFRVEEGQEPDGLSVRVSNPSPYFITLTSLELRDPAASSEPQSEHASAALATLRRQQERMIAPWSDAVIALDGLAFRPVPRHWRLHFGVVNDHGGESRGERSDASPGVP